MKYTGGVRITLTSTARPEFRAVHHRRRGRPLRWHCAAPVRPPLRRVVAPAGRPRVPGPAHADAHLRAVARRAVAALRQRRGPLPARQHRGPPGCAPRSAAATATRRHVTTHCRHAPLPARTSAAEPQRPAAPAPEQRGVQAQLEAELQRRLAGLGDSFESGPELLAAWGYTVDANGTVPYTG
jgi:hypothetical protein